MITKLSHHIPLLAQDAIGAVALMVLLVGGLHLPGLL
ncbi:hypothetical protein SAMN05444002_1432 [Vannielia litorea]|uniref:Uncharacterized protein n=1 Tax=Vannielia litorea TaxID=1217970 RepID=A0A1N6F757_9RHOB|nr:hypothetical protein SAMN05444002_1432 [Vannielia litorea]